MGGRGAMLGQKASERIPEYKTVGYIAGVKVLEPIGKNRNLPAMSNTPNTSYILMTKDEKSIKQFRTYDYSRHPVIDIDFDHAHNNIVPHIHFNTGNRKRNSRALTAKEMRKYKMVLEEASVRVK